MNDFKEILKDLCLLNGTSGDEDFVREYICGYLDGLNGCEYKADPLGNLIVYKKGKKRSENKVMVSAHMDEVGMIVTSVKQDGTLTVSPVGGIDARVAAGRGVTVGEKRINGVIGSKAVHNMSSEEKKTAPKFSDLYVDIGAADKDEALKHIYIGDRVCFDSEYIEFGDGLIKSKAIDDRFGCALLLSLAGKELEYDCILTFTVQEEVGLRGAKTAAYTVNPDFAIVIEATTAADIPLCSDEKRCSALDRGAVVSYMDKASIYDKEMYNISMEIAKVHNIKWQTKSIVAGGNDAGAIHISRGGIRTLAISAPCRYLHSPCCVVKYNDLTEIRKLTELMIEKVCGL